MTELMLNLSISELYMESTQNMYSRLREEIGNHSRNAYWVLQLVGNELGFSWQDRRTVSQQILAIMVTEPHEAVAAERVWKLLGSREVVVKEKLGGRADQIFEQIGRHLVGETLLDFGCGDGQVGAWAKQHKKNVFAYDVTDYRARNEATSVIPFTSNWNTIQTKSFDSALAVAVFHHCDWPEREIERLARVARRVIVIESVLDATMPWAVQALVDWVYNRGMHPGALIPVPGNFRTVNAWESSFKEHGFKVFASEDLGIDLPVVPEHHYLFVLERV